MSEARETRLKRLSIRSWRRGTKEMDLILGPYADGPLHQADDAALDAYEALIDENDNDLYTWVAGTVEPPARHLPIIRAIRTARGL